MKRRAFGSPPPRYALSPPPVSPGGSRGQATARKPVSTLAGLTDLRLGSPGALRRKARAPLAADGAAYVERMFPGARKLGAGAYGAVFLVRLDTAARAALDALAARTGRVRGEKTPTAGEVVVKVALKPDGSWADFVRDNMHESQVHARLAERRCVRVACAGGAATSSVCAADVVPELYFAGPDDAAGAFVTVMGRVSGETLDAHLQRRGGRVSAETYVAVEKAVCTLWLLGIAHGDLHAQNLMIDGDRVTIIDFGFGVVLPPDQMARVQRLLDTAPDASRSLANAVWYVQGALQDYVNTVMRSRADYTWYNPDGKLLRVLYNKVADASRVGALRAAAWKCPAVATPAVVTPASPAERRRAPARSASASRSAASRSAASRSASRSASPGTMSGLTSLFVSPVRSGPRRSKRLRA